MVLTAPPTNDLDTLLNLVATKLDLTPTLYNDAVAKYQAVGRWLAVPGTLLAVLNPDLFPQGSFRIGTMVKPRSHEEYDLDIVVLFQLDASQVAFSDVYRWLGQRLAESDTYKKILRPKNRCWRLDYAGSFHMDILPACPDLVRAGSTLLVPDRTAQCWKPSDPKGYASWFESRSTYSLAEKAIQPIPPQFDPERKPALVRTTQLIKRQRDQVFMDADLCPASIVLTTLAAWSYQGQPSTAEGISGYLSYVIGLIERSGTTPFRVPNPTNPDELLSERWESLPGAYREFCRQVYLFKAVWEQLLSAGSIPHRAVFLKQLFGEEVTTSAIEKFSQTMGENKVAGSFGMRAGASGLTLGAGSGIMRVPPNTNFGNPS